MSSNDDVNSLLSKLETIKTYTDYLTIDDATHDDINRKINNIISNWISNNSLSNDEKKFFDLFSNLQLSFIEYWFYNSNKIENHEMMCNKLRRRLFHKSQIDKLTETIEFIRQQNFDDNNNGDTENDKILIYVIRMIDTRTTAYRLFGNALTTPPNNFVTELRECLDDRSAKSYLRSIAAQKTTNQNKSLTSRHQFFVGCCTFAIAIYEKHTYIDNNKYVYLLARYVRMILRKTNFEKEKSIIYCLRGILALLTNCFSNDYWLPIINKALKNQDDDDAQEKNPFNIDLFSIIINNLLGSEIFQRKIGKNSKNDMMGSYDEVLLVDTTFVFLQRWSDTQHDVSDEDDENNNDINSNSSIYYKPNQLLCCFRSHKSFEKMTNIVIKYIAANYDRIRLMALSILSNILMNKDFVNSENSKKAVAKNIVEVIFDFIKRADNQESREYKGIPFETLLRYLHRFLIQDFVKNEILPYVSQIVDYAKRNELYAFKILRRISTDSEIKDQLLKDQSLKQFIEKDAAKTYGESSKMYKIFNGIRHNLKPPKRTVPSASENNDTLKAFISYCHANTDKSKEIYEELHKTELFSHIWIDRNDVGNNLVDSIIKGIQESSIIFTLLSDQYCASDACRDEWEFARNKKKTIYRIIVQKDFNRDSCDWITYGSSGSFFYNIHKEGQIERLIKELTHSIALKNKQSNEKLLNKENKSSTVPKSNSKKLTTNKEYVKKPSLITWTPDDVQEWCNDNHLEKWCEPLTHFDGRSLITLRRDLSKDSYVQFIANRNDLDGFDICRFKSELDKLLPNPTITRPQTSKLHQ